ncbi:hypothetical protein D3C76_1551720 [compost metagenome]
MLLFTAGFLGDENLLHGIAMYKINLQHQIFKNLHLATPAGMKRLLPGNIGSEFRLIPVTVKLENGIMAICMAHGAG